MLKPKRYSFIGLDIGASAIKAAQVSRTGKQTRIEAAAVIPYPSTPAVLDEATVKRVRDVLNRQGFRGNRCVIAAPADKLHLELLDLPPRHSGAPVDQLARAEMTRLAKLEGTAFEMATWDLPAPPRGGTGTAVIAVATKHADTETVYNLFDHEGLSIEAMDVQVCAIARACRTRQSTQGITAVLDLGFSRAVLMFIREGVVVFQRSFVLCGTGAVQAELIKRLGIDADVATHLMTKTELDQPANSSPQIAAVQTLLGRYVEMLSEQLESSFAYISHRYSDAQPTEILVIGGGAMSGGIRDLLKTRLAIAIEPVAPMTLAECAPLAMEKCSTPLLTTAVGLALYEGD